MIWEKINGIVYWIFFVVNTHELVYL